MVSQFKAGIVVRMVDGVVSAVGMSGVHVSEIVFFPSVLSRGMVLGLRKTHVNIAILMEESRLRFADSVFGTGSIVSIRMEPFNLVGCVVDALGVRIG